MTKEQADPQPASPTQPESDAPANVELNLEVPRYETVEKGEDQSDVETKDAKS